MGTKASGIKDCLGELVKNVQIKFEGGMGFRDLQAFNLAMLAKQGWRMMSHPSSSMARLYKARYFPNNDVLSANLGSNP